MALEPGTRFGPYAIAEPIGTGGMGEVYRATDTVLKRDVALKVLPQPLVEDVDRLARFQREAEILASLNHPNIATIHGLEKADGQTVIVMELVEGPTLADRIAKGPIPPDEAMGIALQVVAALEAAHDKQIVHRDLKPANVKVRDDGTVKVLDFGISKPIDPSAISGGSPVATTPAVTQTGVIMGTAAYMSPEQARGKFVDQRTDIWAFGCLLFEMLTGQPAFVGEDMMAILARVIDRETDLSSVPKSISPAVRHTMRLCLAKDPAKRIADIRDVRLALEGTFESELAGGVGAEPMPRWRLAALAAVALIVGAVLSGIAALVSRPEMPEPEPTRFTEQISGQVDGLAIAVSDDGSRIAWIEGSPARIRIKDIDRFEIQDIEATIDAGPLAVCFSPDGTWIAYGTRDDELRKAPVAGGNSLPVASGFLNRVIYCDWASDGMIYFGANRGILRAPESGGDFETLAVPDSDTDSGSYLVYAKPQLLPGATKVLLNGMSGEGSVAVLVHDLDTERTRVVLDAAGLAWFAPSGPGPMSGHIVYGGEGSLFAAPFDVNSLETGPRVPIEQNVASINPQFTPSAGSDSGTLAYFSVDTQMQSGPRLAVIDRSSGTVSAGIAPPADYGPMTIAPTNDRLAVSRGDGGGGADIRIISLSADQPPRRLALDGVNEVAGWSEDATTVYYLYAPDFLFGQNPPEIRSVRVDGSADPVTLAAIEPELSERPRFMLNSVASDGRLLVGTVFTPSGSDIWLLELDAERSADAIVTEADLRFPLASGADEAHATVSPDENWIAYSSTETGEAELHVRSFPDFSGNVVVSEGGGIQPRWHPEANELFFISDGRMMVASYSTEPSFSVLSVEPLFPVPHLLRDRYRESDFFVAYDFLADRDAFVMLAPSPTTAGSSVELRVVQNVFGELRERAPWPDD